MSVVPSVAIKEGLAPDLDREPDTTPGAAR